MLAGVHVPRDPTTRCPSCPDITPNDVRSTIQRVLADHGIEPAPERSKHTRWGTFLRAHWGAIAATDFFTVEVLTWPGLVRYYVMFIDLKSRRVEITGLVHQPYDAWMRQVARNLTDVVDGFLRGVGEDMNAR